MNVVAGDTGFDLESFLEDQMVSASDRDTHDNTADDQLDSLIDEFSRKLSSLIII